MPRLLFLALPLAVACGGDGADRTALEEARATWADEGAADYVWEVQRLCFCEHVDPIEVEVVAGEVASAVRMPTDSNPVEIEPSEYEDWFTVAGMFALAERALDEADAVTITYAAEGYPSLIDVDWLANAVDDESTYTAEDYAPILE